MTTGVDVEKIKSRLRALLAKTPENGCTEAEAIAAAEKAAKLMAEYSLSTDDLEITTAKMRRSTRRATLRDQLWAMVAHVTNTAAFYDWDEEGMPVVVFYGQEPGPTVAVYLRDICDRSIDREIRLFKEESFYKRRRTTGTRRDAIQDFTKGIVSRLRGKLLALFRPVIDPKKSLLAYRARDTQNPAGKEVAVPQGKKERFSHATNAGWNAGGNIEINRGVGAGAKPLAIGGGK